MTSSPIIALEDIAPAEATDRVREALARFSFEDVRTGADFALGYRLLDAEFGASNELERHDILERWFRLGTLSPPEETVRAAYHMMLVRDAAGQVVAVRDVFTALDPRVPRVVVLMSHSLVLPAWRRSGIAAILRAAPVSYARRIAAPGTEIQIVAEMEPVELSRPETIVRLVSYGRAGFRIVPPPLLPYAQPDFRDTDALGVEPTPLPFLLVVRQVGEEDRDTLSAARAVGLLDHLDAIHRPTTGADPIATIRAHALAGISADGPDLPLWSPPRSLDDHERLGPLLRSRLLPLYPPAWHGTSGPPPDPDPTGSSR